MSQSVESSCADQDTNVAAYTTESTNLSISREEFALASELLRTLV